MAEDDGVERLLPLPTATMHILVALAAGEKHGYAVMGDVEEISGGVVRLGPGTLYGAIKRMLADDLIEESGERPDPALDDQRRRYYRLTALGHRTLAAEVSRLELLVRHATTLPRGTRRVPRLRGA